VLSREAATPGLSDSVIVIRRWHALLRFNVLCLLAFCKPQMTRSLPADSWPCSAVVPRGGRRALVGRRACALGERAVIMVISISLLTITPHLSAC
jgi:hypothetical protein